MYRGQSPNYFCVLRTDRDKMPRLFYNLNSAVSLIEFHRLALFFRLSRDLLSE